MLFIKSTIFNITLYLWTVLSVLVHLPVFALPKRHLLHAQWRWGGQVNWLMDKLTGIELEIRGLEHISHGPCMIASKHQSAWDTMSWLNTVHSPAIVVKSELLWIPIYGQMCMKSGMIIVDRKGQAKALKKMIADGKRALAEGRHILIFPQGSRTAPDEPPDRKPYQIGVAALYGSLDVPVVPVALNSGLFWPRRSWVHYPGKIVLEFLEPIEPGLKRKPFMQTLEQRIESRTAELVAEGRRDYGL